MAQVVEIAVPDIGEFTDIPVIEVLVKPGQTVQVEDPLVALESDKATMEVPSPRAGVIAELRVAVGDKVSEGTVVLIMEPAQADGGPAAQDQAPSGKPPAPAVAPSRQDSGLLDDGDAPYASPAVRRRARAEGIDLSKIQGSGRAGRITVDDLDRGPSAAAPAAARSTPAPAGGTERVELSRVKQISGPRLTEAWQTIPHVTQHDEADITELEAFRKRVNASQDVKVTMVALLMKACVASLQVHPEVNSSLDTQSPSGSGTGGDHLVLKRFYHLGFAADTPQGLLVPVIRDVERKGLLAIAAELRELSGRAREGRLKAEEMRDATFTISSLGGIGGSFFTPIVNPPQVAILGVSKAATKPVWDGDGFVPRLLVPLSLSYDHRVVDGALAARFVTHLSGVLADLRLTLL